MTRVTMPLLWFVVGYFVGTLNGGINCCSKYFSSLLSFFPKHPHSTAISKNANISGEDLSCGRKALVMIPFKLKLSTTISSISPWCNSTLQGVNPGQLKQRVRARNCEGKHCRALFVEAKEEERRERKVVRALLDTLLEKALLIEEMKNYRNYLHQFPTP
ncbi:hypothetical protein PIB30_012948 [Stylosanthes scabra]|uniref:Uncharacterized protein n=1 Tax=Stylosanthes scabra TaxID=79078 RepID=A0ABU6Y350_9FABA|nr:hypothetical protein [Stylosanthes scabra]